MATSKRIGIGGEAALSVDTMTISLKLPDTIEASDTSPEVEVSLSLLFRFSLRLFWRLDAFLAAGVEIPFNPARFVVRNAALSDPILATTWPVRPAGLVGVSTQF